MSELLMSGPLHCCSIENTPEANRLFPLVTQGETSWARPQAGQLFPPLQNKTVRFIEVPCPTLFPASQTLGGYHIIVVPIIRLFIMISLCGRLGRTSNELWPGTSSNPGFITGFPL